MSLWAVFVMNLKQVVKEFQTRDRLVAELLIEHFPKMKERLARVDPSDAGRGRIYRRAATE